MEERGVSVGPDGSRLQSRYRRIYVNSILLFLSLIASLAVAELLARAFFEERANRKHQELFIEHDPHLGWRKIPNTIGVFATDEYQTTEKINSKGIRGPEYEYTKRPNEFRIFVLGDSFAEGYTVDFEDLFSEVLKRQLNNRQDRYFESINTGTGGYSTDQEFIVFQREGRKYNPNLTILLFYYNDVYYNTRREYWRGNKPAFEFRDDQLVVTNVPVPLPGSAPRSLAATKTWLHRNSKLYRFVSTAIKGHHVLNGIAKNVPEVLRVWETSPNESMLHGWKLTEALIMKLKAETRAIESNLLIFYVPHRVRFYEDDWQATKRKYGLSDESWDLAQVAKNLKDICLRIGVDFIDPTSVFKAETEVLHSQGKRLYWINDSHWTRDGHDVVGRMLAQYVTENYLGPK